MSIVNISLDTNTRQMVLTVNGIIVPFEECNLSKWVFDGEDEINFSYTTTGTNSDGLSERRQFFLPSPKDLVASADLKVDENDLCSKIAYDDTKAKADVIDFLKKNKDKQ